MIAPHSAARATSVLALGLVSFGLALLPGCSSSSSGSDSFIVRSTSFSVAGSTPVEASGALFAFIADEATLGAGGTDLNGDGDVIDGIAVVVNSITLVETDLAVAALELEWVGSELFLVVDEALDQTDWDMDASMDDVVLLHWNQSLMGPELVDTVAPGVVPRMTRVSTRLYYRIFPTPAGAMMSNLAFVDAAAPTIPVPVMTQDMTAELSVRILGEDSGLLFLGLDETVEARDLNGDADSTDTTVLALLDATNAAGVVRSTGLALPGPMSPRRALATGVGDWLVAFLVDETAQGATNLNDATMFAPSWQPVQCNGFEDADTTDAVLHFLHFAAWDTDPMMDPPVNTGLVGGSRVLAVGGTSGFVGTLSTEADEGTCDLNSDGDTADRVFRYVRATTPVLPPGTAANVHAVAHMLPGGASGVVELDGRFVIIVDEAADNADYDGDPGNDDDLIAWVAPSEADLSVPFEFDHAAVGAPVFFGATWLAPVPGSSRMAVAISEAVTSDFNNDGDTLDAVPAFPDFVAGPRLNFPGATIATIPDNAGAILANGTAYFRVDEMADGRDWNGDSDMNDFVLVRLFEASGSPAFLSVVADLPRLAVDLSRTEANPDVAVLVVDETVLGTDVNDDMDTNDRVLRFFRQ